MEIGMCDSSSSPIADVADVLVRGILDSMHVFVGLFSLDGRVLEVNTAPLEAAGLKRDDIIGRQFEETYWWSHSPAVQEQLRSALRRAATGETVRADLRVRVANGRTIIVDATFSPLRDATGQITKLVGSGVDVTARCEAEEARHESELRFRQVVENIHEVFWVTNVAKDRMIYISPGYERVFGRTCESLYASPASWIEAIHPQDQGRIMRAARTKQVSGNYDEEYSVVWPDGSIRTIRDRAFPVRDADGAIYRIAGVAEDITDKKQLEEQLYQSQKMEALGQLAGGISHDFNNLLTVISGCAELLLDELPISDPRRAFADDIKDAGERAASLTRQLLAFSRKQALAPAILDLNEVIRNTEKMLRRVIGEDVELLTFPQPCLSHIKADPGQMEQILLNLAVNARDAMPHGGRLRIETRNVEISTESALARKGLKPGAYVMLEVTDSGIGMSEDVRRRVFEPFFTAKEPGKGTGLGLAVVHGIVTQSEGHVEVLSQLGAGACFKLYFPQIEHDPLPERFLNQRLPAQQGEGTILLVEDDQAVRAIARRVLSRCGYRVLEASHGDAAREIAAACIEPIHLLVTDVVMPGTGGRLLAKQLLMLYPDMKVLYLSGHTDDAIARSGIEWEQVHFLQKPFSPLILASKVAEVLGISREEGFEQCECVCS